MAAPSDSITYESFEIRIGRSDSGYPVTVSQSAAGDAAGFCSLNPQAQGLQAMLAKIAGRRGNEDLLLELGTMLFDALLQGSIATAYRACLNSARARGHALRLRLTIDPPELAALPWEFLFDTQEDAFLAISPQAAVVRYLPVQAPAVPAAVDLPLRVLVVSATPQDFPLIDAERGARTVVEALAELSGEKRAEVEVVEHATAAAITQAMRRVRPHIFHFIGHGAFENDQAVILLEDEAGNGRAVSDRTFREFLTGYSDTRLVVLSACQSATVSTRQPMVGLAPRLLQRQVAAVVAMQYEIPQEAAFVFAREFYRSIALGYPLEAAVTEGRRGIYLEGGGQTNWAIPVLFLRAQDGTLFAPQADTTGTAGGGPGTPAVQIGDVASGGVIHISGTVIGTVGGDVHVTQTAPIEVQAPPAPILPPVPTGFVGRERELALYSEKVRTTGRIVITGMPGVGKTAIAAKVALSAAAAPKIFWHTFRTGEGVDLLLWELAGFAAWHGKADLWQLLQRSPQPPPHETLVVSLLHALRGQGFVLTLDDLQYVDEDPALAGSIKRLGVAIDSRELVLIATADRLPANIQVATAEVLDGFSLSDTRLFLEARSVELSEKLSADLHAKTDGNVELLNLAANALQKATDPQRLIDRLAEVENIGHYLLNEVDQGLNGAERRVMEALAVLGGLPSRADAVEAVLDGVNPRRTLLKLSGRYLVSSQMGQEEQEYAIPAILQAFYYGDLGRRERTAMHARAGAYYVDVEQSYLRAARHYFEAGATPRAAELATGHLRMIVNSGQVRGLRSLLERFTPDQLPLMEWALVKVSHGEVCRILGDHEPVEASCNEALRVLDQLPPTPKRQVLNAKACRNLGLALQYDKPQEALEWLQRGLAQLEGLPPTTPGAVAESGLIQLHCGSLQIAQGEFDAAREAMEAAIAQLPPQEEFLRAGAYRNLGTIYSYQGDFGEAARCNDLSLTISRRLHDDLNALAVLNNMGIDKEIAGDWQGAATAYAEALRLADQLESVVDQARIGNALALLNVRRGDLDAAQQVLVQAIGIAPRTRIGEGLMFLLHTQAELDLSRQEWEAAGQALAEAERLAGELDAPYVMVEVLTSQAQLGLAQGDAEAALARVERALELADELELEIEKGKALRVLGQVQVALSDADAGMAAFAQSQDLLADEPYEVARTQAAWGAVLHAAGDGQGAALLHAACQTFAELGAQHDHEGASALLGSSG